MQLIDHQNQTPKDVCLDITGRLNQRWNLDLIAILSNEAMSESDRLKKLRAVMLEAAISELDQLSSDSGHKIIDKENDTLINQILAQEDIEIEPNVSVTRNNYDIIRSYEGQKVYDYVFTLSKRLESMANATTPGQLAVETVASSLFTVGTAWGKLTWNAWRGGQTLLQATRTGITSLGMKTAITVIIIVLAAVLLYLFLQNPKKILGVIYNDTDDMLEVKNWNKSSGNLHMEHGEMKNFMSDYSTGDLDSPKIQIRSRNSFGANDPDDVIWGGLYFADRNFGLRGSEGVIVFSSTTSSLMFAHQFAVPYVNDNGTFMQILDSQPNDLSRLFREMYDKRQTRFDQSSSGIRMTSTVNDPRGGVVAAIGTISTP
ncbi:hypothetical protein [Gilvimarinus agarilyticus]|uniref:hypothetical protein n=1 Tax=Gilvimarinus agarilyticus TaxID=679259 RepID=UPI0005A17359|nr:hypothetical protein [Gilvimarinus agarilyticus]